MKELEWRKCPLCGAWSFYIDIPGNTIITIRISYTEEIKFTYHDRTYPITDKTRIHCLSCSWSGTIDDLD